MRDSCYFQNGHVASFGRYAGESGQKRMVKEMTWVVLGEFLGTVIFCFQGLCRYGRNPY
jgi:hypothetical protein